MSCRYLSIQIFHKEPVFCPMKAHFVLKKKNCITKEHENAKQSCEINPLLLCNGGGILFLLSNFPPWLASLSNASQRHSAIDSVCLYHDLQQGGHKPLARIAKILISK